MEKALKRKGETREKQWEQYFLKHPDGYRKTQFNEHYNLWSKKVNSSMHMEHKSGDKMYVDYTGDKLSFVDQATGEVVRVEVFVAILGFQPTDLCRGINDSKERRLYLFLRKCPALLRRYATGHSNRQLKIGCNQKRQVRTYA